MGGRAGGILSRPVPKTRRRRFRTGADERVWIALIEEQQQAARAVGAIYRNST